MPEDAKEQIERKILACKEVLEKLCNVEPITLMQAVMLGALESRKATDEQSALDSEELEMLSVWAGRLHRDMTLLHQVVTGKVVPYLVGKNIRFRTKEADTLESN